MASTDATAIPIKNQAYRVTFPIFDADGDLVTGAAGLDSEVSKDGGAFADATSEATEIAASSGMYYLDLSATEMNADTVAIIVKTSTTGAKTTPIVLYPKEAGDLSVTLDANSITSAVLAASAGTEIANAILDLTDGIETGWTLKQVLRIMASALAGELSGAATTTIVIRNIADTKTRITATVDSDGNRGALSLDAT